MKRSLPVFVLGSLCVVSTALATTYVRVEKDDSKTYSDRPLPGGQPVDLQPAQSYSAPAPAQQPPNRSRLSEEDPNFRYDRCTVTPANDSTFTNPEMVPIAVQTSPMVRPSDTLIMRVDGQTVGQPGTMSWTLNAPIDRGTHIVSVIITDGRGVTVCSASSSFHVMHPTVSPGPSRPSRPNIPRPTPH